MKKYVVRCQFYPGGKTYDYETDIPNIEKGDQCVVPSVYNEGFDYTLVRVVDVDVESDWDGEFTQITSVLPRV